MAGNGKKVIYVGEPNQLTDLLRLKYVVINFRCTWCAPCQVMASFFERLAAEHSIPDLLCFTTVNTDVHVELVTQYEIRAHPTIYFYYEGNPIKPILFGPQLDQLKVKVNELSERAKKERT